MKTLGSSNEHGAYWGAPCRKGHIDQETGLTYRYKAGHCSECKKEAKALRDKLNPQKAAEAIEKKRASDAARRPPIGRTRMSDEERRKRAAEAKRKKRQLNKEAISQYTKNYYAKNSVRIALRNRVYRAIKQQKLKKTMLLSEYGIDLDAIAKKLGPCPGNHKDWHIDHIKPLSLFNLSDKNELLKAFSPENHQWLPAKENLMKSAKYA